MLNQPKETNAVPTKVVTYLNANHMLWCKHIPKITLIKKPWVVNVKSAKGNECSPYKSHKISQCESHVMVQRHPKDNLDKEALSGEC
jgi:hypothetical protein